MLDSDIGASTDDSTTGPWPSGLPHARLCCSDRISARDGRLLQQKSITEPSLGVSGLETAGKSENLPKEACD